MKLILLFVVPVLTAWDKDAGLVPSLTLNKDVTVTSNPATKQNAVDGDFGNAWQSGATLPTGWMIRPDLNVLLNSCQGGGCQVVGTVTDINKATDGSVYGRAWVNPPSGGTASFTVFSNTNVNIKKILIKGEFTMDTSVMVANTNGNFFSVANLTSSNNYYTLIFEEEIDNVNMIVFEAKGSFGVSEVGLLSTDPLVEMAYVDLGSVKNIGVVHTRYWDGGNVLSTELLGSVDSITWDTLADLNPSLLSPINIRISTSQQTMRYIAVKHTMKETNWNKAFVYEIAAFDVYGPWGAPPTPQTQSNTFRHLLGINGIWGWQTGGYSDLIPNDSKGPELYTKVAGHARNFHNMNWDVTSPSHVPDYVKMANGGGTEVHGWLNWDREYSAWAVAGLTVTTSIQFSNLVQPVSSWTDPEANAYNYGLAFASHFGTNGIVSVMEVGNEPWDYPAEFYAKVLRGMTSGAKAGYPGLPVLPCALQGDDVSSTGNYLGTHIPEDVGAQLDGVNSHHYSYIHEAGTGKRIAVHPEHKDSNFNGIRNVIRWRNQNMPGKQVWVTEWGWDAPGATEICTNTECVSEEEQAVYGVRGLMILARSGVDAATWFFFANLNNCNTLYCRSGLTGSSNVNFQKKKVFIAFQALLHHVGDYVFKKIVKENDKAYIYSIRKTTKNRTTHFIAWAPVGTAGSQPYNVKFRSKRSPKLTWKIDGNDPTGTLVTNPSVSNKKWTVTISAVPIIIELV